MGSLKGCFLILAICISPYSTFSQFDWPNEDICESRCTTQNDRMTSLASAKYSQAVNDCATLAGITCAGCVAAAFVGPVAYFACVAACGFAVESCRITIENSWVIYLNEIQLAGEVYADCLRTCQRDDCI